MVEEERLDDEDELDDDELLLSDGMMYSNLFVEGWSVMVSL